MHKIAVHFELNNDWIGGSYYIRNLIAAMGLLPEDEQPQIFLISEDAASIRFIQSTGYAHIGWITAAQYEASGHTFPFDVVFPYPTEGEEARTISWIPDFQELHLDYFFSAQEIEQRRGHHRRRFKTAGLVVSSEDVKRDVEQFYPGECKRVEVVRFASFNDVADENIQPTKDKYRLDRPYIMCANQIWVHKNHIVLLRAIALLKEQGIDVTVVFTGNENDYRVPQYGDFLKKQVEVWGIEDRVYFLGFIPRDDQLCLMKGSEYIVQPSLFEGWSTVIEDAKSLGKYVIASDLDVHKEQLTECRSFFSRHDPQALAETIREVESLAEIPARQINYETARQGFARDFMTAVETFLSEMDLANRSEQMTDQELWDVSEQNLVWLEQNANQILAQNTTETAQVSAPPLLAAGNSKLKEIVLGNAFKIAVDEKNDSFKILMIYSDNPIELNRKYNTIMVKVVYSGGGYFVELRSSSISPNILEDVHHHEGAEPTNVLRFSLRQTSEDNMYQGVTKLLAEDALEDIQLTLQLGIKKLKAKQKEDPASVEAFWEPLLNGISLKVA